MSNIKKLMTSAAGGAGLNVEDVFSTYLYEADGTSSQTITNNIDLSTEGGLVLLKSRAATSGTWWYDTERGVTKELRSDSTGAESTESVGLTAFNTDGFTFGFRQNQSAYTDSVSWSFRKAPKFFDVVTFTSASSGNTTFSHDLGTEPAFVVIKNTQTSDPWIIYHRSTGTTKLLAFTTSAAGEQGAGTFTATSTDFTVASNLMYTSQTYVAYLFAHNDGDGGFGPDGDQDIIKCGSYTGNGLANGPVINLGFEPQWLMVKASSSIGNWHMFDTMRGIPTGGNDPWLNADESSAENPNSPALDVTATGFKLADNSAGWNGSSINYIYMAIRRGPLAQPESATEVFAPVFHNDDTSEINVSGGFTADAFISKLRSGTDTYMTPRLLGGQTLRPSSTAGEVGYSNFVAWDTQEGVNFTGWWGAVNDGIDWQFKRAPGFFDVVAYTGNGTAGRTVSHNLGVAPEMMWVKSRSSGDNWYVYHKDLTSAAYALILNQTAASLNAPTLWNSTAPTDSVFTVGSDGGINGSTKPFIAYLFATLPGVSKVGSYTGNSTGNASGITQTIDCGFTSGARFVLIKKTNGTGSWAVFDTERGIVSGNDPYLQLNDTAAESTVTDAIDPHSSGFTLTSSTLFNSNGDTYIFYAIA